MSSIFGVGWINSNSSRNYPFTDNVNLSITNDAFIPNDFIVDARVYLRNTYEAQRTPYISSLQILADKAVITISCDRIELGKAEVSYELATTFTPDEAKGTYYGPNGINLLAICSIKQNEILSGILVISVSAIDIIQSLEQKIYTFAANQLEFVPAVCEYLPGPQVTSINGATGDVVLRGEPGIRVEKVSESSSDIAISIVGDSHFTRANCIDSPIADLGLFLEQLTIVHHPSPNSSSNLTTSSLNVTNSDNGFMDLSLSNKANMPLAERAAFRVNVQGNTIRLSMAGQ